MSQTDWQLMESEFEEPILKRGIRKYALLPIIAFVLGGLLIGSFTYWQSSLAAALGIQRPVTMLEHAGGVQLTATKLENHIPLPMHKGHTRYWLGPLAGTTYTTNCITPGILKVGYLTANQSIKDGTQPLILVSAYESEALYEKQLHLFSMDIVSGKTNARGDILSYNSGTLNEITIQQNGSKEIITIVYSSPQSIASMIADSERLVPL